jgi:hypothetical protein
MSVATEEGEAVAVQGHGAAGPHDQQRASIPGCQRKLDNARPVFGPAPEGGFRWLHTLVVALTAALAWLGPAKHKQQTNTILAPGLRVERAWVAALIRQPGSPQTVSPITPSAAMYAD